MIRLRVSSKFLCVEKQKRGASLRPAANSDQPVELESRRIAGGRRAADDGNGLVWIATSLVAAALTLACAYAYLFMLLTADFKILAAWLR